MAAGELPSRPDLDHLKHQAKSLHRAFLRGDPEAVSRVREILGARTELKLTEAQRVIAREYGFASWARLRTHVEAACGVEGAIESILEAVMNGNAPRARRLMREHPDAAKQSVHVAAVFGVHENVRRQLAEKPALVSERAGEPQATPLGWLCWSPFHAELADALEATARLLLDAGADPNERNTRYQVPILYAVTGHNHTPRIARMLLDAGANPNDGESAFHAAEKYHVEALELLMEYGADLNAKGDWGNTPLYFLLRYWKVHDMPDVQRGVLWLLDHNADPNVRCGKEDETSLHVAVRRNQHPDIVRLLIDRGADVSARRGDGRTPWALARRGGNDELAALLETHGASAEPGSDVDRLLEACARGDVRTARRIATPELLASLGSELRLLPEAAREGRSPVVEACLAAGFPVDTPDEFGATALHHAAISGLADVARVLLRHGPDLELRDPEHNSTPLGWACFGADHVKEPGRDYPGTVRQLLDAGARWTPDLHAPQDPAIRAILEA